ncbi:MAG: hypothetical protein OEX02_07270 [Cyclobacteriaceae bacterium]|nr:hypothetical protein [Cyclobacteriaceae bacterium]
MPRWPFPLRAITEDDGKGRWARVDMDVEERAGLLACPFEVSHLSLIVLSS